MPIGKEITPTAEAMGVRGSPQTWGTRLILTDHRIIPTSVGNTATAGDFDGQPRISGEYKPTADDSTTGRDAQAYANVSTCSSPGGLQFKKRHAMLT